MLTIRSGEPGALLRYWQRGHASNSKSQDLKTHQQNAANTNGLSHWPALRPVVGCYGAYFQSALPVAMVHISRAHFRLLWCRFPKHSDCAHSSGCYGANFPRPQPARTATINAAQHSSPSTIAYNRLPSRLVARCAAHQLHLPHHPTTSRLTTRTAPPFTSAPAPRYNELHCSNSAPRTR